MFLSFLEKSLINSLVLIIITDFVWEFLHVIVYKFKIYIWNLVIIRKYLINLNSQHIILNNLKN